MVKRRKLTDTRGHVLVEDPPIAVALFSSTKFAWLWLIGRLWVGYQWLNSGFGVDYFLGLGGKPGKFFDPAWMQSSSAIRGYWERAVAVPADPAAKPLITFDWYREFLQFLLATNSDVWFSKVIVAGEILVGLGLVLGALVGVAAVGGGLMNWSFLMAGTTSTNPLLFAITGLLILGWKVAGYYGLDRYLLPLLGTPWKQQPTSETPMQAGQPRAPKTPRMAYEPW